jgi:hypothetical protein
VAVARRRDIASTPVRTAAGTWEAITDLITVTLERAPKVAASDVRAACDSIGDAGRALVAGGHLDRSPLTVIASTLYLMVGTVSGDAAFQALDDENPNPVPGAGTAETWTVYLPRPNQLAALVDECTDGVAHVSTAAPPTEKSSPVTTKSAATIDLRRLDPELRELT